MEKRRGRSKAIRPSACTECQRRKQKCSREWPCNHCQMRRISHLCRFTPKKNSRISNGTGEQPSSLEIRQDEPENLAQDTSPEIPVVAGEGDLRVLGYLPDSQSLQVARTYADDSSASVDWQDALSSEMESALRTLPPKPYTDTLVQNFLEDANYHYYCLYPPTFSDEYSRWWENRASGRSLMPEFTCLVLRVCACSLQFLKEKEKQRLEFELGEKVQNLTERYHRVAQQLSRSIPPGKGGLMQIQQLFLTGFWFKNNAMFIESWHTLAAAIHEAQELGMHKSSSTVRVTEFEREMRRRVWCLLYAWDWQMSTLLSRPLIINGNCCSFEMPTMRLESSEAYPNLPSPVAHMVLQCQLGQAICKIPDVAGGTLSPLYANMIQQETERWFSSFPPAFNVVAPDEQFDKGHPYVSLQRYQLYASGYMTMLTPIKSYLTKNLNSASPEERNIQKKAVSYSLKLMDASRGLFECIFPVTPNFHFAIFMIFDTATFLCSAIIHDKSRSLFQRDEVIEAIASVVTMMDWLGKFTKLASTCNVILRRLIIRLPLSPQERMTFNSSSAMNLKPQLKSLQSPSDLGTSSSGDQSAPDIIIPTGDISGTLLDQPEFPYFDINQMPTPDIADIDDFANIDFGELSRFWDWESLDLSL